MQGEDGTRVKPGRSAIGLWAGGMGCFGRRRAASFPKWSDAPAALLGTVLFQDASSAGQRHGHALVALRRTIEVFCSPPPLLLPVHRECFAVKEDAFTAKVLQLRHRRSLQVKLKGEASRPPSVLTRLNGSSPSRWSSFPARVACVCQLYAVQGRESGGSSAVAWQRATERDGSPIGQASVTGSEGCHARATCRPRSSPFLFSLPAEGSTRSV